MSQNPKKPVISELIDDTAGVILAADGFDLGLDDLYEDSDDWEYDGIDDLDFSAREEQCTECQGHGTIDCDGDEDECHVCRGTGYVTYLP
jgi:hypothetical protein